MTCIFCAIIAGDAAASIVHQDEHVLAFCDIAPFTRGHTLVIPRTHTAWLSGVPAAESARMWEVGRLVNDAVRAKLGCPAVNLLLADGEAAWQTVFHTHLHVIPRWGREDRMRLIAKGRRTPDRAELDDVAALLADGVTG